MVAPVPHRMELVVFDPGLAPALLAVPPRAACVATTGRSLPAFAGPWSWLVTTFTPPTDVNGYFQ